MFDFGSISCSLSVRGLSKIIDKLDTSGEIAIGPKSKPTVTWGQLRNAEVVAFLLKLNTGGRRGVKW